MREMFTPRFRKVVLSLMVCWMFVLGGVVLPSRPAYAQVITNDSTNIMTEIKEIGKELLAWARSSALLSEIIDLGIFIYELMGEALTAIFDLLNEIGKVLVTGEKLLTETQIRLADHAIAAHTAMVKGSEQMRYVADHPMTGEGQLCRSHILAGLAGATEDFQAGLTQLVGRALQDRDRGPGESGNTVVFAARMMNDRCKNKFGSPVDGYPLECISTDLVGPFKRSFVDADLSPFMMDGAVTLEVPLMEAYSYTAANGQTMTYLVTSPQNLNQKAFVAAFDYCFNLAGPRPTPPSGDARLKSKGLVDSSVFEQGSTVEGQLNAECAALLTYYTRPNVTQQPQAVKELNERCEMARKSAGEDGMVSNAAIVEKFDDCKKGLSPYQAEFLAHAGCKSTDYYVQQVKASGLQSQLIEDAISCNQSWMLWQKNLVQRQGSLVKAVEGLMGVKEIWGDMSNGQKYANTNERLYGYVLAETLGSPEDQKIRTVNSVLNLKPKKKNITPVVGVPFSADEMSLPAVVSQ